MYTILTMLGNKCLGKSTRGLEWTHNQQHVPISRHYFCPVCGEVWAKVVCVDEKSRHHVWTVHCSDHGTGSLLCPWDDTFNRSLPLQAIVREIDLLLKNPDKYNWR